MAISKSWGLLGFAAAVLTMGSALPAAAVAADDGLHSEVAVYGWMKSLDGETGGEDISLNFFQDILENIDGALFFRITDRSGAGHFSRTMSMRISVSTASYLADPCVDASGKTQL